MAENTQIEAVKGGESEALKRAAYKWGIGRYLYEMPEAWCEAVVKGKGVVLTERPSLPAWAYPYDWKGEKEAPNSVVPLMTLKAATAQTYSQTPAAIANASKLAKAEELQTQELQNSLPKPWPTTSPPATACRTKGRPSARYSKHPPRSACNY